MFSCFGKGKTNSSHSGDTQGPRAGRKRPNKKSREKGLKQESNSVAGRNQALSKEPPQIPVVQPATPMFGDEQGWNKAGVNVQNSNTSVTNPSGRSVAPPRTDVVSQPELTTPSSQSQGSTAGGSRESTPEPPSSRSTRPDNSAIIAALAATTASAAACSVVCC